MTSSSIITSIPILLVAVILTTTTAAKSSSSPMTTSSSGNTKPLQFTSPIQSYTIFDKSELSTTGVTPRRKFLPRFRAGLIAERRAKEVLMDEQRRGIVGYDDDEDDIDGGSWAEASAAADERKKKAMDKRVEAAYDTAVSSYDARVAAKTSPSTPTSSSNSKYQFVGLVNDGKDNKKGIKNDAVQWYARKKPKNSKWNVRTLIEDNQVRELYGQIYCHLYVEYPAIRRMVKSALKTDLCIKGTQGDISMIQSRFIDKGGNFWVATDNNNSERIIGCVGVQKRKMTEKERAESISSSPESTIEYEIHRLAVDNTHRGKGTGRKLLSFVEEYICNKEEDMKSKRNSDDSVMIKLWATTPAECLFAANKLYNTSGYERAESFQAGSLCMNVYCKTLI